MTTLRWATFTAAPFVFGPSPGRLARGRPPAVRRSGGPC
jgi:hypothetical protein